MDPERLLNWFVIAIAALFVCYASYVLYILFR